MYLSRYLVNGLFPLSMGRVYGLNNGVDPVWLRYNTCYRVVTQYRFQGCYGRLTPFRRVLWRVDRVACARFDEKIT